MKEEEKKILLTWLIWMRNKYKDDALKVEVESLKERFSGKASAYDEVIDVVEKM